MRPARQPPYELFLQLEGIEHRTTKVRRTQANGFIEGCTARWLMTLPGRGPHQVVRDDRGECRRTWTPTWRTTTPGAQLPRVYDGFLISSAARDWQQFRLQDSWAAVNRKAVQMGHGFTTAQLNSATSTAISYCMTRRPGGVNVDGVNEAAKLCGAAPCHPKSTIDPSHRLPHSGSHD